MLPLPTDLPRGRYQLVIGLYDAASGERLPLSTAAPSARAPDGDDALHLTDITVR